MICALRLFLPDVGLVLSTREPAKLRELSAKMEKLYRELVTTMHVWPDAAENAAPARKAGGAGEEKR